GHHVEAGLGIDQLQVPDRAAGLLHRRAVEVLSGVDDDAFSSESLFGCTHLVLLRPGRIAQRRLTVSSNPLPTGTPQLAKSGRLRRRATNGASSSACVVVLSAAIPGLRFSP